MDARGEFEGVYVAGLEREDGGDEFEGALNRIDEQAAEIDRLRGELGYQIERVQRERAETERVRRMAHRMRLVLENYRSRTEYERCSDAYEVPNDDVVAVLAEIDSAVGVAG